MLIYGKFLQRATCKLCRKRRVCRIDTMNRYFTAEASGKLIPVCLQECSRFKREEKLGHEKSTEEKDCAAQEGPLRSR